MPPFSVIRSSSSGASKLPAALWGPAQRGGACAAQAFCLRQTLGAGAIELSRAGEINGGPHGAGPVGRCGGPAKEAVERQIEAIEQFVRERT